MFTFASTANASRCQARKAQQSSTPPTTNCLPRPSAPRPRASRRASSAPSKRERNAKGGIASVEWFIQKFLASEFFVGQHGKAAIFAPGTQRNYRPVLERMCLDTMKGMAAPIGKAKFADFTPKAARTYLHKVAEHYRPTVARTQLMLLSNLWQFAMRFDEFDPGAQTNPFAGIGEAAFYTVEQEHEPWPDDVIERFLAACDENLYFAFHLLLCSGQRVSDVCAMKWSQYDGARIALTQIKTQRTNDPMRIRVPDVLKVLLDRRDRVHEHILTHKWGRPYTRDSLSHRIKEVLIANGDGQYTVHGLGKNAGIMLAENGATVPMIMAALGHKSPKLALYYTRLADQAKLSDQASEIVNMVFNRRAAAKDAKAKARRAQIREVE